MMRNLINTKEVTADADRASGIMAGENPGS